MAALTLIASGSGCERDPSSGSGATSGATSEGRGGDATPAVSTSDRGRFPSAVDVDALDPAVVVHLADRLAAVEAAPDDPSAQAALADAWLAHDRADLAVEPARRAAAEGTSLDRIARLVLLGDALAAVGDIDGAIEAGRTALAIRGDDPGLLWRVAGWQLDAGELAEARVLATRATALASADPVPSRMLATILLADGRADEAIQTLQPFVGDPRDGATQYLLSRALSAAGRSDEAADAATLAGSARPAFVDPWLAAVRDTRVDLAARLAWALDVAAGGRHDDALAMVTSLRSLYPGRRELDATEMGVHALANDHEAVLEVADRLIAAHPDWSIPRVRAGFAALAIARRTVPPDVDRLARAARDAEVLVGLTPNDPQAYDLRGRIRAAQARWDEALLAFERAMELEPAQGRHRVAVGECLVAVDRPLDAIRVVNEMDRVFGRSVDAALVRVRAMAVTGRAADARGLLEQCRRAMPTHPGLVLAEQALVEAGG